MTKGVNTIKKVLIFALISALALTLFILPGCTPGEDSTTPIDNNGNPLYSGRVYELPEGITFLSGGSSDVVLTATVLPETAANKLVDWEINWSNPDSTYSSGKTVTDYVTVTPDGDGSRTATVSCLQAFEENIIITVITRDGGFTANCVVSFAGVPTGLNIDTQITTYEVDGCNITPLGSSSSYTFDINLSNDYDLIGQEYGEYDITVLGMGEMYLKYKSPMGWVDTEPMTTLSIADIMDDYIDAYINNGVLHIYTGSVFEAYRDYANGIKVGENVGGDVMAYPTFYDWNCDKMADYGYYGGILNYYIYIEVEEINTGLKDEIHVKLQSSVQNASLNRSEIVF